MSDRPIDQALKEIERLNIKVAGMEREVTLLNLQMNRFIIAMNVKKQKEKEENSYVTVKSSSWW